MTATEIKEILELHRLWLSGDPEGKQAYLWKAYLWKADLKGANLARADLWKADLLGADLRAADLRGANLRGANLTGADLREANLTGAYLTGADLREADLKGANLTGAYLTGAYLTGADLPDFQIVPEEGAFVGWKMVRGGFVLKLEIPRRAWRTSSLVGRKCRAGAVKVLAAMNTNLKEFGGIYDNTKYRIGSLVYADAFDYDPRIECTGGIHFFMTRKEAEQYDQ